MKSIIRPIFALMILGAMIVPCGILAEAAKCSPCQAAKSIRDALAQSIKDAQMSALAAGGSFSRQSQADQEKSGCGRTSRDGVAVDLEKCGCGRTTRDEMAANIEQEKCGCQRTTRDEIAATIDVDATKTVAACCAFCAMPGSLGCQGENRDRCNTCQQGRVRMAAAFAAAREAELDEVPADTLRAPREALADPCNPCGAVVPNSGCCAISKQLEYVGACCNIVNQRVIALTEDSQKCCKRLREKTGHIENLIGDPAAATVMDIPTCGEFASVVDVINGMDSDLMTWLKSIYYMLYLTYNCACDPCAG